MAAKEMKNVKKFKVINTVRGKTYEDSFGNSIVRIWSGGVSGVKDNESLFLRLPQCVCMTLFDHDYVYESDRKFEID